MKIVFNIISILILILVAFLATLNSQTMLDFTIWSTNGIKATYHIGVINLVFCTLAAGMFAGVLWAASFYLPAQIKLKEYQKKLEKTSADAECDSSKVSVLEAKIEVLEKALQSALEDKGE